MNLFDKPRKPRSNSVLDRLSGEQKERLQVWLGEENRSYEEVRRLVATEFGVVTSRSALSRYFRRSAGYTESGVLGLGFGVGTDGAEELAGWRELPEEASRKIEGAALARARHLAFRALASREPDVKLAERMIRIVVAIERRRVELQRVELLARRVEILQMANGRLPNDEGLAAREGERGRGMENAGGQLASEEGQPGEAKRDVIAVRFGGGGAGAATGISHFAPGRAA